MATTRICSIDGCGKKVYARGWCRNHYMRNWAYGDPLGGKTSRGAAKKYLFEVVLKYEGNECLTWPFARTIKGYGLFTIDGRSQIVSRLVCEKINGPPPTPQHEAAHSCGKGHMGCIAPAHLSWKTTVQNKADQLIHGTRRRGTKINLTKLTETDVREIRGRISIGDTNVEIAQRFNVTEGAIRHIRNRRTWHWL